MVQEEKSIRAIIKPCLAIRYQIQGDVTVEVLETARLKIKLGISKSNEMVTSSLWLSHGNISAKDGAHLCYLQDRDLFGGELGIFKL